MFLKSFLAATALAVAAYVVFRALPSTTTVLPAQEPIL
jgi:hypothetical protein